MSRKQIVSEELRDQILQFIRQKFYPVDFVAFSKDRPRLLNWVVLKLAVYVDGRGVTLEPERYRQIMINEILMKAIQFGDTRQIGYVPAWLGKVVDTHLAHHGEEYYYEGKAARTLVEHAMLAAGKARGAAPDPVRELAQAARLLKAGKRPQPAKRTPQLDLFK